MEGDWVGLIYSSDKNSLSSRRQAIASEHRWCRFANARKGQRGVCVCVCVLPVVSPIAPITDGHLPTAVLPPGSQPNRSNYRRTFTDGQ